MQPVRSLATGKFAGAFRRKAGKNIDTETVKSGGGEDTTFCILSTESSNNSLCAVKSIDACCRGK